MHMNLGTGPVNLRNICQKTINCELRDGTGRLLIRMPGLYTVVHIFAAGTVYAYGARSVEECR